MAKPTSKILFFLQYAGIRMLLLVLKCLPFAWRGALIGSIARFIVLRVPGSRRRIFRNLELIYPDMPKEEKSAIAKSVASNAARSLSELLMNSSYRKRMDLFHADGPGLEVLKNARSEGKGAIIVSAHFGQWEAIRHVLKSMDMETGAVYRENTNPFYEKLFLKNIRYGGAPIVSRGSSGNKEMLRHLRSGGFFALLVDQKAFPDYILPFMGKPAMTTSSPSRMALKFDIPIVPAFAHRSANGQDIEITFEEPIEHSDVETMTVAINDRISDRIRQDMGQWYWFHDRWSMPREDKLHLYTIGKAIQK